MSVRSAARTASSTRRKKNPNLDLGALQCALDRREVIAETLAVRHQNNRDVRRRPLPEAPSHLGWQITQARRAYLNRRAQTPVELMRVKTREPNIARLHPLRHISGERACRGLPISSELPRQQSPHRLDLRKKDLPFEVLEKVRPFQRVHDRSLHLRQMEAHTGIAQAIGNRL
jgi:hypothetical protein